MILQTADGTKYQVSFRHYLPCRPTRIKGKGVCRGEARIPIPSNPDRTRVVHADRSKYVSVAPGKVTGYLQVFSLRPKTECIISRFAWSDVKAEAVCSPLDTFSKKLGRRIALGRALNQLGLTEAQRTELLADYASKVASR